MDRDIYEARLVAAEIALDALLAEIEELRERLEACPQACSTRPKEIHLT